MKLYEIMDIPHDTQADLIVQLDAAIRSGDNKTIKSIMGSLLQLSLKQGE